MNAMSRIAMAGGALALSVATPSFGQNAGWAGLPMQSTVMRNLLNNATHGQAGPYVARPGPAAGWGGAARGPAFAPPPPERALRVERLPYGDDPAITARVVATFLDGVRQRSGAAAAARMQQVLAKTDFRSEWARMVSADGLRTGDLIDAMSAYWVLSWMIVHHADNTRAQTLAARAQVTRAVAATPGLAHLDPAGRQTLAETLMLQQVIQGALYVNALHSGDRATLQTLSANTERSFSQEFGMDLAAYALTDRGFVAAG